jgi:hypothetical protein
MQISISEIINKLASLKTNKKKIEWIHENDSTPLRIVLRLTYDSSVEFLIPNTAPPWKKNAYVGVEGMLYKEARRLRIFVKGCGYDQLKQVKRETLFITLLEDVNNDDAILLTKMITQKPFKGLTVKVLLEALPDLFQMKLA